ncbi:MAG: protein phosphatase 2C domain-containing protein [Pseudomonadota bacterium]
MTPAFSNLEFGPRFDIAAHSCASAAPGSRLENQDNFLLVDTTGRAHFLQDQQRTASRIPDWPAGHARVAVLDGMGGHGRGREAAEAVVAGLLTMPPCDSLGELSTHLDALHTTLQHHFAGGDDEGRRPGTTLTLLELRPDKAALLYHVGDSRLYEIGRHQVQPMTVDHVPATAYAMAGHLAEHEWWQQVHGEHRSQISQAFILGNAFSNPTMLSDPLFPLSPLNLPPFLYHLPDRRALELAPGAVYLLATDGFWACADPCSWLDRWPALFDAEPDARAMVTALFGDMASAPPPELHHDNLTAVVVRSRTT